VDLGLSPTMDPGEERGCSPALTRDLKVAFSRLLVGPFQRAIERRLANAARTTLRVSAVAESRSFKQRPWWQT
jgi:hypothetical protein